MDEVVAYFDDSKSFHHTLEVSENEHSLIKTLEV